MATECLLIGIMKRRPAETLGGYHLVEHDNLVAVLAPPGRTIADTERAELARLGAVLPPAAPMLVTPQQVHLLLAGETPTLIARLQEVAGTRQIDIRNADERTALALMGQLDPAPLAHKRAPQDDRLCLLVPAAAAAAIHARLTTLIAGTSAEVSLPLPPADFAGFSVDRMSAQRLAAAEILADVSSAAPSDDILDAARRQMSAPVTSLSPQLAQRRTHACRLLMHIAKVRERLMDAGLSATAADLVLVAPKLQSARGLRRAA